ncbi:hypothetical protein OC835_005193 [Tilletia horrida]|nr:hypothetical protein OC835_005193 [Tilletia horrida]
MHPDHHHTVHRTFNELQPTGKNRRLMPLIAQRALDAIMKDAAKTKRDHYEARLRPAGARYGVEPTGLHFAGRGPL